MMVLPYFLLLRLVGEHFELFREHEVLFVERLDSDMLLLELFRQILTRELLNCSANFNLVDTNSYSSYLIRKLHYAQGFVESIRDSF